MRLFTSIAGLRTYLNSQRFSRDRLEESLYQNVSLSLPLDIGFVPTMGALHAGHLSLIRQARRENKIVVVSIFVNPLQFAPGEDLDRYPRTFEADQALCESAEVDVLFVPTPYSLLPTPQPTQVLPPATMMADLCGRSRTGHFQGVATIVVKLLNIVQPTRAYFGQKDAQQLAIIRRLVADLNLPVDVVACPTVREESGLALSSRNQYLSLAEREQAATIHRGLRYAEKLFRSGERRGSTLVEAVKTVLSSVPAITVEYVELVDPNTMETLNEVKNSGLLAVAARLGTTRLIDNLLLSNRQPIVAIDGPAGAGKSTVARMVAHALGLLHLDTGSMYRALTWFVLKSDVAVDDEPAIAELLSQCQIEFKTKDEDGRMKAETDTETRRGGDAETANTQHSVLSTQHYSSPLHPFTPSLPIPSIFVNGHDVTQAVRSVEVTSNVSTIAAQPAVRQELLRQQQACGRQGGIVVEGRDIGTHVFPDAELKIFLTASVQERARRRQKDLQNRGIAGVDLPELERAIGERDRKDSTRAIAPLRQADDAIELNTDGLSIQDVIDRIVNLYQERLTASENS